MTDPLLTLLENLPPGRPDPSRADRIRVRCHAALVRERRRMPRQVPTVRRWPPIAVALGGLYLTEVVRQALAVYGLM